MSRLMSVAYTEDAVRERRKTVTRRKGWWQDSRGRQILKPGDRLTLCRKVMGRKAGEPLVRICEVEVVDVRRERLSDVIPLSDGGCMYAAAEMEREGFPGMDPREFVRRFFTDAQGIRPDAEVTRIEFRYLEPPEDVTVTEGAASGFVKLACIRCPYTGALSTHAGAIAAAWTHHRTHERSHR